jgi:hypothetical protein
MSSIKIDTRDEKIMNLLYQLGSSKLPSESAGELKSLLEGELTFAMNQGGDFDHISRLNMLIERLAEYINGKIDLMAKPKITVSNVV